MSSNEFADHDPRLVTALGELTMAFTSLEETLQEAVWSILGGNEERAQIMTAGLSFSVLVEKLAALFAQKFDHLLMPAGMAALRLTLISINERRNRLVHSVWVLDVGTGMSLAERRKARAGIGIDWQSDDVTLESVQALLKDIADVHERLWDLVRTGDDAFKALGPKRRR